MNFITDEFRPPDEQAIAARAETHPRELRVRCCRLPGSSGEPVHLPATLVATAGTR